MSLQHDVKRYEVVMVEVVPNMEWQADKAEAADGELVLFTDYEAVRGEVERLTAAKEEGDLRYAEIARQRDFEWDRRKRAEARAETAEASLRSLRDALEKYGSHLLECEGYENYAHTGFSGKCTCGFVETRAALTGDDNG
jgi:hypothetical protein